MTPFIIAPDADGEVAVWDNTDPEKPVPVLWRPYVQHDDLWNLIVAAIPVAEPTGLGAVVLLWWSSRNGSLTRSG